MPSPEPTYPGARVRSIRERAGLSQSQLAGRLGWSRPRLSQLEGGVARPKPATVARLAAALGCEPGEIDPEVGVRPAPAGDACPRCGRPY